MELKVADRADWVSSQGAWLRLVRTPEPRLVRSAVTASRRVVHTAAMADEAAIDENDPRVHAKWLEIAEAIDVMVDRSGTPSGFVVAGGSSIARDDALTSPYQASHAIAQCIVAGTDHLHAVKQLIVDDQVLHTSAPQTLTRAALENYALAYWMIRPPKRWERVKRTMQWYAQNALDQHEVSKELASYNEVDGQKKHNDQLARITETAARSQVVDGFKNGYSATRMMRWVDANSRSRPLFAWRLCSGFTHGRPWASLGALQKSIAPSHAPGVQDVTLTNSLATALVPVSTAMHLLEEVLSAFNSRSQ